MVPNALVLLLLASVLTYPLGGDAGPIARRMLAKEKMTAWIDVCVTYDRRYTEINPYFSTPNIFREYLQAFVKAVELRFRDLENTEVLLSTARIEELKWILPIIEGGSSSKYVESDKTIQKLTETRERNQDYYMGCDVLLFITGYHLDTHLIKEDKTWHGLPQQGSVCQSGSVAFIHDNGRSFSGVNFFAQQLAFLLNASLQTSSGYFKSLMSQPDISFMYNVHLKGRAAIRTLLETRTEDPQNNNECWRDVPFSLLYPLPVDYLGTMSSPCSLYSLQECNEQQRRSFMNNQGLPEPPCKHICCSRRRPEPVNWPDGKHCGVSSVCVSGWCVNMATGEVMQP
uniref:Putative metalloprotease n=1 Tax=Ixodes ricinus TaxID=34613 RepID=A0A0K8R5T0_IXORI